jgi:CubicO group peptidase (beta-lactamase class C family)
MKSLRSFVCSLLVVSTPALCATQGIKPTDSSTPSIADEILVADLQEPLHVAPAPGTLDAAFDAYIQAAIANAGFSGTVLVAKDGVPVFRRSYGLASQELAVPNNNETVYDLASITKPFTALLIMMMQEEGRLNVDDLACTYLTDCPATWQRITIRQLLTHTSGIESYSRLPDWDETLDTRIFWRGGAANMMRDQPLRFSPGEGYRYSNTGFDLLGLIVERVSGKTLPEMYQDRILSPLGMNRSGFHTSRMVAPGAATGYYSLGSTFINRTPQSSSSAYGSSGLFSTVDDLLKWDQALYSNKLISASSYQQMIADAKNEYGLGWEMRTWLGRRQFGHAGSGGGFSTLIARFIDDRLTVVVLSNSDEANANAAARDLAAIYFGQEYQLPSEKRKARFLDAILVDGADAAIQIYRDMKAAEPEAEAFRTDELLVTAGYDLHGVPLMDQAKRVFEFALEQFPRSAYSHDGLADVALAEGQNETAIRHFETSLAIDPTNEYAIKGLERVRALSSL